MPEPSASAAAPLHPPAHMSPSPSPTAGSGQPSARAYKQGRPARHHGRDYVDRAPSLVPGVEESGPTAVPPAPAAPEAEQQGSASSYEPGRRVLRVLPLGAGMMLVGLGLGFLGLRLRRL
ncbi:hypothetical protein [Streptomyces sp. NBC_01477]|uniref:hypothetical protein n=1 Tax=Streptomyces sp. NBC_01477 TaxID=2976015 RepID=UPI002E36D7FB|nr:hypothetical protein [Streptomyces sp. NBC_01477]